MEDFYTTEQLAAKFPALFSVSMLKKSRMRFTDVEGPPFIRRGRKIIYIHADVLAWIQSLRERRASAAIRHRPQAAIAPERGRPTKAQEIARRQHAA